VTFCFLGDLYNTHICEYIYIVCDMICTCVCDLFVCAPCMPPKNGVIALWPNTRVVKCKYYVSQKQMGSIIRSTRTVLNSLLYLNSRQGFNGLKHLCPVISVKMERLPGNTKNRLFTRSWTARVRLVHSWAV